jgi:hypothetical protein
MISLYFHSVLKNFPDVNITHITALLHMRLDLNKAQINEAIEGCNKILQQREIKEPITPSK